MPELPKVKLPQQRVLPNFDYPFWCPKCERVRGIDDNEATCLNTVPQAMSYHSFGMCEECVAFSSAHPDQVLLNEQKYLEKQAQKEAELRAKLERTVYRVYINEQSEKITNAAYALSISGLEFWKFAFERDGKYISKARKLVEQPQAEQVCNILKNKGLDAFYERENLT